MSFLDRIHSANKGDSSGLLPFDVLGRRVGYVSRSFAEHLSAHRSVFVVSPERVTLVGALDRAELALAERSAPVTTVLAELHRQGVISGWRDELYPVSTCWSEPPCLLIERAAVPLFGVRGYGVHLNGFVRDRDRLLMWVAKRADDKPTFPSELDQLAAGGQPYGLGLYENMRKECLEEAGIPMEMSARIRSVSTVTYTMRTQEGYRPDAIFNFDLELPREFVPMNNDGEVAEFYLWPITRVAEIVEKTDEFKFNCALVVVDFLVRHGVISSDHPHYVAINQGLRARWHASFASRLPDVDRQLYLPDDLSSPNKER